MVSGPTRPFLTQELPALDNYLKQGGRALFLLSPQRAEEFIAFLEPWGVKVGNDVVVDQVVRLFQGPALGLTPLVDTYDAQHEITREMRGRTIFPMTRSVSGAADGKPGLTVSELVKTSPSSWAESDVDGIFTHIRRSTATTQGSGPIAVASTRSQAVGVPDGKITRLAVVRQHRVAKPTSQGTYFTVICC